MKTMKSMAAGFKIDLNKIFRTIFSVITPAQKPALQPVRVRARN